MRVSSTTHEAIASKRDQLQVGVGMLQQKKGGGIPKAWDFNTATSWNCAFAVLVPVRDRLAIDSMVSVCRQGVCQHPRAVLAPARRC